jgi:hypothetical protein
LKVKDLQIKLNKLVDDKFAAQLTDKLGKKAKEIVKTRTKAGEGVKSLNSSTKPLKPLSPKYVERRRRLSRSGKLSRETTPTTSNLTKTGAMLNDIEYTSNSKEATVFIKSDKNRKKAIRGKKDRPFMNLAKKEV